MWQNCKPEPQEGRFLLIGGVACSLGSQTCGVVQSATSQFFPIFHLKYVCSVVQYSFEHSEAWAYLTYLRKVRFRPRKYP